MKKNRSGVYIGSNVSFDPNTGLGLSYGWWQITRRFPNNALVFNSYKYSVTTQGHQKKLKKLLGELGMTIHYEIEAPDGLQDLSSAIKHYESKIQQILSKKKPKELELHLAESYRHWIVQIEYLMSLEVSQKIRDSEPPNETGVQ